MIKKLKKWFSRKRVNKGNSLPPTAVEVLTAFKTVIVKFASQQNVSWFGKQIVRYIEKNPDAVTYQDGSLRIDVNVTSNVPGDWGDEMFEAMYSLEKCCGWVAIKRKMFTVPEDYKLPEHLRSKEYFVGVHWVVRSPIIGA